MTKVFTHKNREVEVVTRHRTRRPSRSRPVDPQNAPKSTDREIPVGIGGELKAGLPRLSSLSEKRT